MESFVRRLKYYGIGFGIGIIFVFFFFRNRGCSWLPENRVKNSILDRLIVVPDETARILKEKGLGNDYVMNMLNDGDVVFNESDKNEESKVYVLEKEGNKLMYTLPYESFVSEVRIGKSAKKIKNSEEGYGKIVHLPSDSTLIYPDTTSFMKCQQEQLGLTNPKDILRLIKETGSVDFSNTDFTIRPKPEHTVIFRKEAEEIKAKIIWYKNKLNVQSLSWSKGTDCH